MDPVSALLMAASVGGGIMSALGGRKAIDPEWLKQHFGANAVDQEMVDMFNHVINSPVGQQMMTNAATQGQQFQNDTNSAAARAGLGPGGGASSGTGIFATSAAQGATNAMQQGVRSNIFQSVMPLAQQMVNNRMNAYLQGYYGTQSTQERLGQALGGAAGTALSFYHPPGQNSVAVNPAEGSNNPSDPNFIGPPAPVTGAAATPAAAPNAALAAAPPLSAMRTATPNTALDATAGGNAPAPQFSNPNPYRAAPMSAWGRFAGRISRFGRSMGNMVTPSMPGYGMGSTQ